MSRVANPADPEEGLLRILDFFLEHEVEHTERSVATSVGIERNSFRLYFSRCHTMRLIDGDLATYGAEPLYLITDQGLEFCKTHGLIK